MIFDSERTRMRASMTSRSQRRNPSGFTDAAATWNQRYQRDDFLFGEAPNQWLVSQGNELPTTGRVLSVADGEGRNSVWLASLGLEVDAFDISEVAVTKARAFAARKGCAIRYAVMDADRVMWPTALYDAVVAIFIQFADPSMRRRLFHHMSQALKPGGALLLQGYAPKQLHYRTGGPPIRSHLYTEAQLRKELAQLQISSLRCYEADVQEGSGHRGRSALVGLVGRAI